MARTPIRRNFVDTVLSPEAQWMEWQKRVLRKLFGRGVIGSVQTADQTINSSTTLASSEMTLPVKKGKRYRLHAVLLTNGTAATPGIKATITHTGQTSPAFTGTTRIISAAAIAAESLTTASATGAAVAALLVEIDGYIACDGNGTVTVQFAQNTSNAGNTVVKAGSYLVAVES